MHKIKIKGSKLYLLACQNCGFRFRRKIDWRKKIKEIKCPKCKKPFRGNDL